MISFIEPILSTLLIGWIAALLRPQEWFGIGHIEKRLQVLGAARSELSSMGDEADKLYVKTDPAFSQITASRQAVQRQILHYCHELTALGEQRAKGKARNLRVAGTFSVILGVVLMLLVTPWTIVHEASQIKSPTDYNWFIHYPIFIYSAGLISGILGPCFGAWAEHVQKNDFMNTTLPSAPVPVEPSSTSTPQPPTANGGVEKPVPSDSSPESTGQQEQ